MIYSQQMTRIFEPVAIIIFWLINHAIVVYLIFILFCLYWTEVKIAKYLSPHFMFQKSSKVIFGYLDVVFSVDLKIN